MPQSPPPPPPQPPQPPSVVGSAPALGERALTVYFYRQRQRVLACLLDVPLDIGRQREGEPGPTLRLDRTRGARVILAPISDVNVSRSHLGLVPAGQGEFEVQNLSTALPLRIAGGETLKPGESRRASPPVLVQFGDYAVRIDPSEEDEVLQLEGLPERTLPPGRQTDPASLTRFTGATFDESSLLKWLETVLGVFHSAATSHDFPQQAALAVVKIVGLDTAAMLHVTSEGRWTTQAFHSTIAGNSAQTWMPSLTLLERVRRERRTFRHVPTLGSDTPRSLQDVSALVAAPILDGEGRVAGALYGDRRSGSPGDSGAPGRGRPEISAFEAKLVELLASGIAAGLARVKEEQAALAARVRFEQFFTPQLASQLEHDPRWLEGRNAEVTLLFADVRGFSSGSERLGPARTMAWIQDTMGALSRCVLANDGVLVDYIGDELMAMWGAPAPQRDHALLACTAACQMFETLAEVNARWRTELGREFRLGIGLNSGVAHVGNTGSDVKFKYGPLGDVVNVASRVQGAGKYLGADCLITRSTLSQLGHAVPARRLARVRVVNIDQAIDIYELRPQPPYDWSACCERYNEALGALESDQLQEAAELATRLAADFPDDRAVAALVERIASAQRNDAPGDASVWQLPGK